MRTQQASLIEELLLDVRFNAEGTGYLNEFASWVMRFHSLDLKTHKRDLIHLAQLSAELSRRSQTAELSKGLAQIVRSALDRAPTESVGRDSRTV